MTDTTMQKKSIEAVLVVLALLFLCNGSTPAQDSKTPSASSFGTSNPLNNVTDDDIQMLRANLRATRASITEKFVPLTADEAAKFWPIFDQYRAEAVKLNDERWAEIKDYAANYNTLTDAQAQDYIEKTTSVDEKLLALRTKYVPVFEQVISPKKTALWYQVDRRLDLMINVQLSTKVPLSNTGQ